MIKHIKENFTHKEIWLLTTMGGGSTSQFV